MKIPILFLVIFLLQGALSFVYPLGPQDTVKNNWKTKWKLGVEGKRNTNIYRLSPSQRDRMNLNDSDDVVSGRYRDMQDDMDMVFSLVPEFEFETKSGLFNRTLSLSLVAAYEHYINNPRRRNIIFQAVLQQKITKKGTIKLMGSFLPEYFSKNYLSDASDLTGNVSESERIYSAGVYSQWDITLVWQQKFSVLKTDFKADVGTVYRSRDYEYPFRGRNQYASSGILGIKIFPLKFLSVDLNYVFEWVHTPVSEEVLILDEPDYIIDFNNDQDFADKNRRTVQSVNRTFASNLIGAGADMDITDRWNTYIRAEYLMKDFKSNEKIDPDFKGRFDHRTSLRIGMDYLLIKTLSFFIEYRNVVQQTNRPEDPESTGEVTDYNINIISTGVQWRIF